LALEQIPPALRKAFQPAKEELRTLSEGVAKQVEHKQFAPAAVQLQMLMAKSELNQEQKDVVVRSLGTVNASLQQQLDMQEATVVPQGNPAPVNKQAEPPSDSSSAEAKAAMHEYMRTK
jgi:hypothetical protein